MKAGEKKDKRIMEESWCLRECRKGLFGREMGKITLPVSSVRVHKTVGNVPLRRHADLRSLHLSFFFFFLNHSNFLPISPGIIYIIPVVLLKEILNPEMKFLSSLTLMYFHSGQKENCTGQSSKKECKNMKRSNSK